MTQPEEFPRRVLFTVSGLTPQIVTETIYGLAVRTTPAFVPTRLVVMTTSDGASRARLTLQGSDPGWLARLRADYQLPPIDFAAEDVRVLHDRDGAALPDIRTGADNEAAADAITEAVRELTADPDCALHVSLAGGRKTLGFFAAYALSLYGRVQDRLSHVLVSPDFEANPEFYYPTRYDRVIYTRDGKPLNTRDADVSLADIPFVRMREGLSPALRTGRAGYAEAVAAVQGRLDPPRLVIDYRKQEVTAGRTPIRLEPQLLALYGWMARRRGTAEPWVNESADMDAPETHQQNSAEFLREYGRLVDLNEHTATVKLFAAGMIYQEFLQRVSKLNRVLRDNVVDPMPERYLVKNLGPRRRPLYGLDLPLEAITIVE
ncbi:MAG TPA: CRISPR-associated ring nuclease Csm6 [Acetobacteraceae bacterium]|nr:CRISPR-associated ring nuclease Csm6 [Acetobacteraceae bacterium]